MPVREVCGKTRCYFQWGTTGKRYYYNKRSMKQRSEAGYKAYIQGYAIEQNMKRRRSMSKRSPRRRSPRRS